MGDVTAIIALLSGFVASSLCLHAYTLLHLFRHEHPCPTPPAEEKRESPPVHSAAVIKRPPVIIDDAAALEIELEHREKKRPVY